MVAATAIRRFTAFLLLLFNRDASAHRAVAGAAHLRALIGVASGGVGAEDQRGVAAAALRDDHVAPGTDDVEAVVRVVAAQPEFDDRAAFYLDVRRREREAFGDNPNHLAILRLDRVRRHDDE